MSRKIGMIVTLGMMVHLGTLGQSAHAETRTSEPSIWLPVPWAQVPINYQQRIAEVVQAPSMVARSGPEEFPARPEMYRWLLDHPDRVSIAWRRMDIQCVPIQARPDGTFHWEDDKGTCLDWRTIIDTDTGRVWYAEGKAHAGPLFPSVPVKVVAVMRHRFDRNERGNPIVTHQVEIYLQTDSRAASLVMRILGPAAPRLAEQGAKQLLLFFAGIARYVEMYPKETPVLLAPAKK